MKIMLFTLNAMILMATSCASLKSTKRNCTEGLVKSIGNCKSESMDHFNPQFPMCEVELRSGAKGSVYIPVRIGDSVELCEGVTSVVDPARMGDFHE